MESNHIRDITIENNTFSLTHRGGCLCVERLHTSDSDGNHWAFMDLVDGSWRVYRDGYYRMTLGSSWTRLSPEQVAMKLLALDRAENL